MEEDKAEAVVEALRARRVFAHVERAGVYQFGVRVVISDGREAIWDTDGAAGLEAVILEDGELVGFVPTLPGSEELDVADTVQAIAGAEYDIPVDQQAEPAHPTPAPGNDQPAPLPPRNLPASHPDHRPVSRLLRRLAGRED